MSPHLSSSASASSFSGSRTGFPTSSSRHTPNLVWVQPLLWPCMSWSLPTHRVSSGRFLAVLAIPYIDNVGGMAAFGGLSAVVIFSWAAVQNTAGFIA